MSLDAWIYLWKPLLFKEIMNPGIFLIGIENAEEIKFQERVNTEIR